MTTHTFAQGEIYARSVPKLPDADRLVPFTERSPSGAWIVSHSETGHHHLLDAPGVTVMERAKDVPAGMRILYALVKQPTRLWQDAAAPHEAHDLAPGIYELRIAREYDPLMEMARQVAD